MRQFSQNIYLSLQILYFIRLIKPLLLVDLNRYLFISPLIQPHAHNAVSALPQLPINVIVRHLLLPFYRHDQV